jgi:hypothetical protein
LAALFAELGAEAGLLILEWRGSLGVRFEAEAADLEVFLEAIGLKQVGEFESTDVATAVADFALEISNDLTEVLEGDAGAEQFVP